MPNRASPGREWRREKSGHWRCPAARCGSHPPFTSARVEPRCQRTALCQTARAPAESGGGKRADTGDAPPRDAEVTLRSRVLSPSPAANGPCCARPREPRPRVAEGKERTLATHHRAMRKSPSVHECSRRAPLPTDHVVPDRASPGREWRREKSGHWRCPAARCGSHPPFTSARVEPRCQRTMLCQTARAPAESERKARTSSG